MNETATMEGNVNVTGSVSLNEEGWEWAIVEIFGHRRHAGRTREEERFGAKMLRIDVPKMEHAGYEEPATEGGERKPKFETTWVTHYYGGSSIFSFTLTDEASALSANKPWAPPYRATAALPAPEDDDEDDFDNGDDN